MPDFGGERPAILSGIIIAAYTSPGVYGTPVSMGDSMRMLADPQADNDDIKSDGYLAHLLTVVTHAMVEFSGGGVEFDVLTILNGESTTTSGDTPAQTETMNQRVGLDLPYFGIVGRALGEDGGDIHVGFYRVKLDKPAPWELRQNEFVLSEFTGKAARETLASVNKIGRYRQHETVTALDLTNFLSV